MADTIAQDDIVNVVTGEIVSASDIENVARVWIEMQEARTRLTDAMRAAQAVLEREADRLGADHLHGVTVVRKNEYTWNVSALHDQLRQAGLPEERWREIVTTVEKVDARKMRALANRSPETYGPIIDGAYELKTSRYIKRGKDA